MEIKPLGPERIRQRIEELQSRIREVFPEAFSEAASKRGLSPSPLQGQISPGTIAPYNPLGAGVRWSPDASVLAPLIERAARENGLDPALLDALVQSESGYDAQARSRAGAMGLTQLMPGTAEALGVGNPFDPEQNLMAGARYLQQLINRYDGNLSMALAAYNAGPGTVQRFGGIPPYPETQSYVQKVLGIYNQRRQNP